MKIDLFDYELPQGLIAMYPSVVRDGSRMLVVDDSDGGSFSHASVTALPDLIPEGALVVVNETQVIPARLLGTRAGTGGKAEIFLVDQSSDDPGSKDPTRARWSALGRASKELRPGSRIDIGEAPHLHVEIREKLADGTLHVDVVSEDGVDPMAAVQAHGKVPLPPYISRDASDVDVERYQTIFASVPGAVAAPTAGLHLSEDFFERATRRGVEIARVTLHVGLGTFRPVSVSDLDDHPMHTERFVVPSEVKDAVARARLRSAPVIAVGTTVVRALESAADPRWLGHVDACSGTTRLLIQPGYRFRVVDGLLTNFHLPRSTLLALVCAFRGRSRILRAYQEAIDNGYRFFSYGDAMFLPPARATTAASIGSAVSGTRS